SNREPVLAPQERVPPRLDLEELRQPVEPAAMERQVGLERRQAAVHVSDACPETVDARVDGVDLRHELLGPRLCDGGSRMPGPDPRVDRVLAAVDVARRGRGQEQRPDRSEGQPPHRLDVRGPAVGSSTWVVRAAAARDPGADRATAWGWQALKER